MRKVIYISWIFTIFACSNSPVPKGIMQPDKMEAVVYYLLRVDEYLNNFAYKDTTESVKVKRSILYAKVFKLHNINRKTFYTSYRYYQQHPDIQKTLFDSLYAKSGRVKPEIPRISPLKPLKVK